MKKYLALLLLVLPLIAGAQVVPQQITGVNCLDEDNGLYCSRITTHKLDGSPLEFSFRTSPPEGQVSEVALTNVNWRPLKVREEGSSDNLYVFDADSSIGHIHLEFKYNWNQPPRGFGWDLVFISGSMDTVP